MNGHNNDERNEMCTESDSRNISGNSSGYVLMVVTVLLVTVSVAIGIAMTTGAGFREQRAVHRLEKTRLRIAADGLLDLAVQFVNDWDSAYQFCSRCVCGPEEDTAYYCPWGQRVTINGFRMTGDCHNCDPDYRYCWSGGGGVPGSFKECWWASCINDTSDVRDPSMPYCVFDSGFDVGTEMTWHRKSYVVEMPNSLPQLRNAAYIRTSGRAMNGSSWFKSTPKDTATWEFCEQALLRWGFNVDQPATVWLIWVPSTKENRSFPPWLTNNYAKHHDSIMIDIQGTVHAGQIWYKQAHPDRKYPMYYENRHHMYTPTADDLRDSVNVRLFPAFGANASVPYGVVVTPGGPFRCKTREWPGDPKLIAIENHRWGTAYNNPWGRHGLTLLEKNLTPVFDKYNHHHDASSLDLMWPGITPVVYSGYHAYFAELPERLDSTWYLATSTREARKIGRDSAACYGTQGRAFYMELTVEYPCTVFVGLEKKWFSYAYTSTQPEPFGPYHYPCDNIKQCMVYPSWEDSLYIWNQAEGLPTSSCVGTANEMGPQMNVRYRPYWWMLNDTGLVELAKGEAHLDTLPPGWLARRYFRRMLDDTAAWSYFQTGDTVRYSDCEWIDGETPPLDTGKCSYSDIIIYQRRALVRPGDTLRVGPPCVIMDYPNNVGFYNVFLKPTIQPEEAWVWESFVDTTWTVWEGTGDTLIDNIGLNNTDRGKVTIRCVKPNFFQVDATVFVSQNGGERYKTTVSRDFSKATGKPQNAFRRDYGE